MIKNIKYHFYATVNAAHLWKWFKKQNLVNICLQLTSENNKISKFSSHLYTKGTEDLVQGQYILCGGQKKWPQKVGGKTAVVAEGLAASLVTLQPRVQIPPIPMAFFYLSKYKTRL